MAEIKDVYSLEFNSGQFQAEVDSAIARIEELNAAMADGADVAEQLAEAQGSLADILSTEAKGVEQLNQKRDVLVNTQKKLNAESKAGVTVGKQLAQTNKQIAVSTGEAVKQQKGFAGTLLDGTRKVGQMRRVLSTLQFAFRAITAAIPFGLILSLAGPVLSFFSSLGKQTDETAENMEKLNDKTLGYGERLQIIKTELEKLETIEGKRGKLTDEEKQRRAELTKAYQEAADEIVKIEEDRYQKQQELEFSIAETRIKLLGDTSAAVIASAELERKKLTIETFKKYDEIKDANDKLNEALIEAEKEYNATSSAEANKKVKRIQEAIKRSNEEFENLAIEQSLKEQEIERNKQEKLRQIAERAAKEREQKEKERIARLEKLENDSVKIVETGIKKISKEALDAIERKKQAEKEYQDMLNESNQRLKDSIAELKNRLETESTILQNNRDRQLSLDLLQLEQNRNEKLLFARQNITDADKLNAELERIDSAYNKQRQKMEAQAARDIIQERIKLLNQLRNIAVKQGDALGISELDKQLAELDLKFQELNKSLEDGFTQVKDKVDYKELIDQTTQTLQLASDTVFQILTSNVQAYIEGLDRAVDKSKTALDDIRQNSENFNARQLEIEKERLEKLEAERARAVEREKTLGQIQVAINAAIAISKAAAEGGGFASAFTIAATLASLIAGLAQARAAAGNAFFHGVEYLERGNNPRGRDTIPAMLNEGERVITTDTNNKYWDVLSAVHNNRIPADVLNGFANAYQQGGLRAALGAFGDNISLSNELGQKSVFVNVAQNYGGLENRLERIEAVLTELPKYMPKTIVQANAKGIFRIVEQRQQRKDYSRNWSK